MIETHILLPVAVSLITGPDPTPNSTVFILSLTIPAFPYNNPYPHNIPQLRIRHSVPPPTLLWALLHL
jgi:hypothetical protein